MKKYQLSYWVILPQGTMKKRKGWSHSSSIIVCRNLKQAYRVAEKYDAPYFERIQNTPKGRFCVKQFIHERYRGLSISQIWDTYKGIPAIEL